MKPGTLYFSWRLALLLAAVVSVPVSAASPALSADVKAGQVLVSWDAPAAGLILEIADDLSATSDWWPAHLVASAQAGSQSIQVAPVAPRQFFRLGTNDYIAWFQTVEGPMTAPGEGVLLPHEHLFTDLRGPTVNGYGQADPEDVSRVMTPLMVDAKNHGVALLIECTGIGVGRNVPVIQRLSRESGLPVVIPTGVYGRANFAPPEHRAMTEDALTELFTRELREGIEGTGVKAGFLKIATSDSSMTALEEKFLRAAGRAARTTGASIASHTVRGAVAKRQADILESISPSIRFVWVHAQAERDRKWHRDLAARGIFIEFDSLGWAPSEDAGLITAIKELLAAGYGDRILLSHDAGWYQPGQPNGGTQKPFTYIAGTFLQKLKNSGVDEATVRKLTLENPARAFAFLSKPSEAPESLRSNR